jgi:tRNA-specific 2-thiouridylase
MARVAVAMSGGVDSSTAAAVLREAGHEVVGLTLQLWDYSADNVAAGRGRCCSPADIADARMVSDRLGMPHYVFDHSESFRDRIVDPFVDGYLAGKTPSPCIGCNRLVKFDALWKLARGLDAEYLATGHYARLDTMIDSTVASDRNDATHSATAPDQSSPRRPRLRKGRDRDKDQSYFLFDVPAARFESVLFPIGDMAKEEVRETARRLNVAVADKPESYELCFIPDGDKDRFVESQLPTLAANAGPIRHLDGRVLGAHRGLHRFTVGQRRGLGLSHPLPLFVVALEPESNAVIVGPDSALDAGELTASRCNWVSIEPPSAPFQAAARIRHRHEEAAARIEPLGEASVKVEFETPQRAVAPGQGVAFYDGDLLLGGGWIEAEAPSDPLSRSG